MVKNLPTIPKTWVRSLDQEDPLEKRMATHSSILAWEELMGEDGRLGHVLSVQTRLKISSSAA